MSARSLVCGDCGAQLRSVLEAQQHGEVTGHSSFAESTDAVLTLVCAECNKPCRSQTEKDLHTKRTGHATFTDQTEQAKPMDTEAEVQAVREDSTAVDGGSEPFKVDAAAVDAEGKPTSELMVPPIVDTTLRQQLEDMGFSANKATRALHLAGSEQLQAVLDWIMEHENDLDLDEPLLLPQSQVKLKLTPEEAKAKADELVRAARAKREREEAEAEKERERMRVRMGKEIAAAKRLEEDQRLRRNLEERAREKEEERRAREKIRIKLEEDRRERRRKLGLPEELTEEEKAAEAAKAKAAEKPKGPLYVKPVSVAERMREKLVGIKKRYGSDDARIKACYATMMKAVGNIVANPAEEKFRRIRLANPGFHAKVSSLDGAQDFLELCGFQRNEAEGVLEMPAQAVDQAVLEAATTELSSALTNPFFGAL